VELKVVLQKRSFLRFLNNKSSNTIFTSIDDFIYKNYSNEKQNIKYCLNDGIWSISLYFYYRFLYSKDEHFLYQSAEFLSHAIDVFFKSKYKNTSLHYGLSGIVFTYNLLVKNEIIERILFFENYYKEILTSEYSLLKFDIIEGCLGNYVSLFINDENDFQSKIANKINTNFVSNDNKIYFSDSIFTKIDEENISWYNLGMAHGLAGLLAFNSIYGQNNNIDNIEINDKCISTLRNLISKYNNSTYMFNALYSIRDNSINAGRLSWCYCDLGIANALLLSGLKFKNDEVINLAKKIAINSCNMRETTISYVTDPYICHGSSGISVIYKNFYEQFKLEIFNEAMVYWNKKTIELLSDVVLKDMSVQEVGLLGGVIGSALSIMTCENKIDNDWQKILLLK
jgi:hypothetical protein